MSVSTTKRGRYRARSHPRMPGIRRGSRRVPTRPPRSTCAARPWTRTRSAALSLAVVVVEAAEKSGSLITARLAAELGREVLAVPGRITAPESRGANRLIQDGAHVAMGWEDVVGVLPERWKTRVTATAGIGRAGDAPATGRGAPEGEPSGYRR